MPDLQKEKNLRAQEVVAHLECLQKERPKKKDPVVRFYFSLRLPVALARVANIQSTHSICLYASYIFMLMR